MPTGTVRGPKSQNRRKIPVAPYPDPIRGWIPLKVKSGIIAFARVLLRAERERFSWSVAIHCARGRLGHRPVRRVSDCEVLAALVPERVLPFASGDSRKRGPRRAGAKTSEAAVGRRKASAPAP